MNRAMLTRRTFLESGVAALALATASRAQTASVRPSPPMSWRKGPVVLGPDPGPDGDGAYVQNFTCPAEPLPDGRWRIWYSRSDTRDHFNIGFAEGRIGEPFRRVRATLSSGDPNRGPELAIGNLPDGWHPVQPVHFELGDGRHRLYFWAHGPSIARYLAADSDDGHAYRVVDSKRPCLVHPNDRAVDGKTAASIGLRRYTDRKAHLEPGESPVPPEIVTNDATNIIRLPDGSFEMYTVALEEVDRDNPRYIAHDNAAGLVRVIDRLTSDDGLRWRDRRRVLRPGSDDPSDLQFYYLAVTLTDRGRIGMLGHYRAQEQTMDLEWCVSDDGLAWQRPTRSAWIDRGPPGEPDSYGIYAPQSLVLRDGRWHLFYTGVNEAHNHRKAHGEPGSVVRVATTDRLWS